MIQALTLLDYCLHAGSENVVIYFKDNIYIVKWVAPNAAGPQWKHALIVQQNAQRVCVCRRRGQGCWRQCPPKGQRHYEPAAR